MKRTTQALFIAMAIFSTTIVSAEEEQKPLIQGVLYTQQDDVVHYDNKRNISDSKLKNNNLVKDIATNCVEYSKK